MQRPPSHIIQTSRGTLEYAIRGQGAAVILCHGTGGGYGQGLMLARLLDGFQRIAVSRAGHFRTPVEYNRAVARHIPNVELIAVKATLCCQYFSSGSIHIWG